MKSLRWLWHRAVFAVTDTIRMDVAMLIDLAGAKDDINLLGRLIILTIVALTFGALLPLFILCAFFFFNESKE